VGWCQGKGATHDEGDNKGGNDQRAVKSLCYKCELALAPPTASADRKVELDGQFIDYTGLWKHAGDKGSQEAEAEDEVYLDDVPGAADQVWRVCTKKREATYDYPKR
jgi:hypothetical protein